MRLNLELQELILLISAIENAQVLGKDCIMVAETLTKLYKARDKSFPADEVSK